jgi:ribosomal RNA assembly protein
VRIPAERVSVLIGTGGETLDKIEELLKVEVTVDDDGEVEIDGTDPQDPLEELRAYNIVKAIGRGFSPEKALRLLEDNSDLCILNINDFTGGSDNAKERLKGRVIGENGQAREKLSNDTDTEIAVYGKTVSILGKVSNVEVAREAVTMLLEGRSHATVYDYLKRNQAKIV